MHFWGLIMLFSSMAKPPLISLAGGLAPWISQKLANDIFVPQKGIFKSWIFGATKKLY